MTEEPFPSWEEQTALRSAEAAFRPKIELARKWITEAAYRVGCDPSGVTVARNDAFTLRLISLRPRDVDMYFDRRLIEGIADSNEPIRDEAFSMIQCGVPRAGR